MSDYTPEQIEELFNERAAIREHLGKFSREAAEFNAVLDLFRMVGRENVPKELIERVKGNHGR